MAIITTSQIKVLVSSMAGDWSKIDGVGGSNATEKVRTTAGGPKQVLTSEHEAADITVTRIFDPATDAALLESLQGGETFGVTADRPDGTVITVQYIEFGVINYQNSYKGCAVSSWQGPSGDANGDGAAEWQITWAVGSQ